MYIIEHKGTSTILPKQAIPIISQYIKYVKKPAASPLK